MEQFPFDEIYMRRALQLAANGRGFTRSNPMVGAVIVAPDGRVIGEGWHRRYGEGHAEVNAVASVCEADKPLMKSSTIYVTLEPCSHYGKTPPCAKLLIDCGFPRVVVGAGDPNPKVNGRGIRMLREAGAQVVTGILADESIALNKVFFTSQTLRRPYIYLKWAQSADGFMDVKRDSSEAAYSFSNPVTRLSTMKLRADCQAILTTAATYLADHPRLTLRNWAGVAPRRFILDRNDCLKNITLPEGFTVLRSDDVQSDISNPFSIIYNEYGLTSVLVEAGPRYLSALLEAGLWDELRVETAPECLGARGAHKAPALSGFDPVESYSRFRFFTRQK